MKKVEPTATQDRQRFTQETHRDGVGSVQDMERSFLVRERLLKALLEEATPGIHHVGEDRPWACESRTGWSFQVKGAASNNCGGEFGRGETVAGIEVATYQSSTYPSTHLLTHPPIHSSSSRPSFVYPSITRSSIQSPIHP